MKLFGHPIHIMLVHFPVALLPMDFVCEALYHYTGEQSFGIAGYYAMCAGLTIGWLAIFFGLFDLINIYNNKPGSMKTAMLHGGINTTVIVIYSIFGDLRFLQHPAVPTNNLWEIIVKGLLVLLMFGGNYLGGRLIINDRVI